MPETSRYSPESSDAPEQKNEVQADDVVSQQDFVSKESQARVKGIQNDKPTEVREGRSQSREERGRQRRLEELRERVREAWAVRTLYPPHRIIRAVSPYSPPLDGPRGINNPNALRILVGVGCDNFPPENSRMLQSFVKRAEAALLQRGFTNVTFNYTQRQFRCMRGRSITEEDLLNLQIDLAPEEEISVFEGHTTRRWNPNVPYLAFIQPVFRARRR